MISISDQQQIGAAGGAATSGRTAIAAVCQTVYNVVLTNRKLQTIPAHVIPAVTAAGLPATSVKAVLTALSLGTARSWEAIPGLTPAIKGVAVKAFQSGLGDAYKTVWLTSLAFTGLGVGLAFFSPNTEDLLTNKVATELHGRKRDEERETSA